MEIKVLKDKSLLSSKRDVLRIHLYYKLIQNGIKPFDKDIDIMIELYMFGGYSNSEQQNDFISLCIKKGFKKVEQSVRNTISKYVSNGVFIKPKNTVLYLSENYIPKMEYDKIMLQYTISHAD